MSLKRILALVFILFFALMLFLAGCAPQASAPPVFAYTITSTAGSGGSINPEGEIIVLKGENKTFTITPDELNQIEDVQVDGISVGPVDTYTFTDVGDHHTIQVSFIIKVLRVINTSTGVEYNSIWSAIEASLDGHTLVAYPGIYKEQHLGIDKNITLRSTDPLDPAIVASTIIDGEEAASFFPFVEFRIGESATLEGFTIRNGKSEQGGIRIGSLSRVIVKNNVITGHSGVGIYIEGLGMPTITGNTITNNNGGGINVDQWFFDTTITGNTITNNNGSGININFYDSNYDYNFFTPYLQIGGINDGDNDKFNTICGNTPNQMNYSDLYPHNYISEDCN